VARGGRLVEKMIPRSLVLFKSAEGEPNRHKNDGWKITFVSLIDGSVQINRNGSAN
jgi:hypothetical protein